MPSFSSDADEFEQVSSYRTPSVLALVGLLLGLAAPLHFFAPLLMVVPLAGIAVSLIALRRIATSDGALFGRGAAATGLALSIVCLLAALTYNQAAKFLRTRQARAFSETWLALVVSDQTERAFQLTAQAAEPVPVDGPPGPARKDPYEAFLEHPAIRKLVTLGAGAKVQFDDTLSFEPRGRGAVLRQQFSILPPGVAPAANSSQSVPVIVTVQRALVFGDRKLRWLVANYQVPTEPAEAHTHPHDHGHDHDHEH